MLLRSACLFAFLLGALGLDAQQSGKVYGVVSDAITGETLIQASIRMGDGGTATDFDGRYELVLPFGEHEITVQYIGYESQTRRVTID